MFKRKAVTLSELLKPAGLKIAVNPVKPRKGYFEVRLGSGAIVASYPAMPRPFKKLREADLDAVAKDVLAALGSAGGAAAGAAAEGGGGSKKPRK